MGEIVEIHPQNPQARLIAEAARVLEKGGVAIYPTDSGYALGCLLGQKEALEKIHIIRQLAKDHLFTLLCRDLSHISQYAQINNPLFRYLKAHTPGPFTFLLKATKEVPKRLLHPKRRTIGIRVPDNKVLQDLLNELSQPMMSVSLELPRHPEPLHRHPELVSGSPRDSTDFPNQILNQVQDDRLSHVLKQVDITIDSGYLVPAPTTIVDLTTGEPIIIRVGQAADEV